MTMIETQSRGEFADAIRAARATQTFKCFARLGRFGRVLIITDRFGAGSVREIRIHFRAATPKPPANIHRLIA